MTASTRLPGQPELPAGLPDPTELARLAGEFFAAWPGEATSPAAAPASVGVATRPPAAIPATELPSARGLPYGVQPSLDLAPPGSPLASPAGLGPNVPGTPLPQGTIPGANLIPATPDRLPPLAHRLPARLPHAQAGNGLPDTVVSEAPAFLPRAGGAALGVPQPGNLPAGPVSTGLTAVNGPDPGSLDALARLPFGWPEVPRVATSLPAGVEAARIGERPQSGAGGAPFGGPPATAHPGAAATAPYYFLELGRPVEAPAWPVTPAGGGRPGEAPAGWPPAGGATSGGATSGGAASGGAPFDAHPAFDVHAVRRDFPILAERVNGRQLVWFDNAATTQKPQAVIDRLAWFYQHENSNIHRAAHELAARATDAYEEARERVRDYLHASEVEEIVFVRGTTEAINLVAKSWGGQHVSAGDEIVVSHLEHHANIVPWQQLAKEKGARLRVIPVDDDGQVLLDEYRKLLNDRTKIVAVTQVSNALGTVVPVKEIVDLAHRAGALALVDGAQSVAHLAVDVQELGADFFVFSGHKIFGPTGIGVLWGRRAVLEDMPPWQGGGNMIADVTFEKTVYQPIPTLFEAGTGNIADAVGLGEALAYVQRLGLANIARYEHELLVYATGCLSQIRGARLIGTAPDKASVLSFVLDGYSTDEVGDALNREGIAVRTGHHCAQPILRRFGLEATVRPSLAFYNTHEEVDHFIRVVDRLSRARR